MINIKLIRDAVTVSINATYLRLYTVWNTVVV